MRKIIITFFLVLSSFYICFTSFAETTDKEIINKIIPKHTSLLWWAVMDWQGVDEWWWETHVNVIVKYVKDALFSLFFIVAVWVFIFLGVKLMAARGNPEEFKKALMWFVYAVVWIVLVPLSYALVKFISTIEF